MAGGPILTPGGKDYPGKLTGNVLITCIIAATGGLIFGYDLGISGNILEEQPCFTVFGIFIFIIYTIGLNY